MIDLGTSQGVEELRKEILKERSLLLSTLTKDLPEDALLNVSLSEFLGSRPIQCALDRLSCVDDLVRTLEDMMATFVSGQEKINANQPELFDTSPFSTKAEEDARSAV